MADPRGRGAHHGRQMDIELAMRGWMDDRPSYVPPVQIGEPMRAGGVGQVVESRNPNRVVGDIVQGLLGWQDYALVGAGGLSPVSKVPAGIPLSWRLGVLGMTGLTAYFGLLDVGKPEKGGWLCEEAHFDAAIDYKSEDVATRLGELCPSGINVYFDNVGGPILDAVLTKIAQGARIVLCGGISSYNAKTPPPGPSNYLALVIQGARMEGCIVIDYLARMGEGVAALTEWVQSGKICHREDIQRGLENAPETFLRLFEGKNLGRQLLQVAEPRLPRS